MATQKLLSAYGTQLLFADSTDFPNGGSGPPTTATNSIIIPGATNVQMDMSVIAPGAAWQSAKIAAVWNADEAWPREWALGACMESISPPGDGSTFDFYWNESPNSAAATGNSGNTSGADSAYVLTASSLKRLIQIGSLTVDSQEVNIDTMIGTLIMRAPYGSLVVVNNTTVGMSAIADETHVVLTPVIPDLGAPA